jgi:hypothetical protein
VAVTVVHVPPNEATPVARKLLDAAAALGLDPGVVRTSSDGIYGFTLEAPVEVYEAAFPLVAAEAKQQIEEAPRRKGGRPRKTAAAPADEVPEE